MKEEPFKLMNSSACLFCKHFTVSRDCYLALKQPEKVIWLIRVNIGKCPEYKRKKTREVEET